MQVDLSGIFQSFSARFTIKEDTVDEVNSDVLVVSKAKEVQAQGKEYSIALILGKKGNEYFADPQGLAAFFDKERKFIAPSTKEECAKVYLFVLRNKETIFRPISTSPITRWPPSATERKRLFSGAIPSTQGITLSLSRREESPQIIARPLVQAEASPNVAPSILVQMPPVPQLPPIQEKKDCRTLQNELAALKAKGPQALELTKRKAREIQELFPQEGTIYQEMNLLIDHPVNVFSEHNMRVYEQLHTICSSRSIEVNLVSIYLSSENQQIQNKADSLLESLLHKDPEATETTVYNVSWLLPLAQACKQVHKMQYAKAIYEKIIKTEREISLTAEQLLECQQKAALALVNLPQDSDTALITTASYAVTLGAKFEPDQAIDLAKKAVTLGHMVQGHTILSAAKTKTDDVNDLQSYIQYLIENKEVDASLTGPFATIARGNYYICQKKYHEAETCMAVKAVQESSDLIIRGFRLFYYVATKNNERFKAEEKAFFQACSKEQISSQVLYFMQAYVNFSIDDDLSDIVTYFLTARPNDTVTIMGLLQVLSEVQKYATAARMLADRIVRTLPTDPLAHFVLAQTQQQTNGNREEIKNHYMYARPLTDAAKAKIVTYELANIAFEEAKTVSEYELLLVQMENMYASYSNDPKVISLYGRFLIRSRKMDTVITLLHEIEKNKSDAMQLVLKEVVRALQEAYPEEPRVYEWVSLCIDNPVTVFSERNLAIARKAHQFSKTMPNKLLLARILTASSDEKIRGEGETLFSEVMMGNAQ